MRHADHQARWQLTDTLSVPVTVLHVADDRARVSSSTGEKWIPVSELAQSGEESK